jgi:hypothetical protein
MKHLGAALSLEPKAILEMSPDALKADFEKRTEREMRRILSILSHEPIADAALIERLVVALFAAGHGVALLEAAAESNVESFSLSVLEHSPKVGEKAEAAALEILERRPPAREAAAIALGIAAHLATERLALVIGRRFFALRDLARPQLNEALIRIADPRLLPLIESRAFEDEPEEAALLLTATLADEPIEGKLAQIRDRLMHTAPNPGDIEVDLRCKRCGETLGYRFPAIFVDPSARGKADGDPAFVGDPICKACGTEDQLEPTETAVRTMTTLMMRYLGAIEQGQTDELRVLPQTTRITGKETGFAEALRILDAEIARSPDSIRSRLRRARVRSILKRKRAIEDVKAVLAIDPSSPEALTAEAQVKLIHADTEGAVSSLAQALHSLGAEPRMYELDADTAKREVENALVRLEAAGAKLPPELDLKAARLRVQEEAEARAAMREEMMERVRQGQAPRR